MAGASDLRFNFHDSELVEIALGPRHELTLGLLLDPEEQRPRGAPRAARLRFGGIENYAVVSVFFTALLREKASLDCAGRVQIAYAAEPPSRSDHLAITIELEYFGTCLITCSKLHVREEDGSGTN